MKFDDPERLAFEACRQFKDRHLLVLTDFDGTLAEIVASPEMATMGNWPRLGLIAMATKVGVTVGVVSGRRIEDIADRVGQFESYVAGLHGLEIEGPHAAFRHEGLDAAPPVIAELAARAALALAWCPGVVLENKVHALACHARKVAPPNADRVLADFVALAQPEIESGRLKMLQGLAVREALPAVDWHKGRAVDWIRARVADAVKRPVGAIYLGDDRTDEDAFEALGDDDLAIGVGLRPADALIDSRLAGPDAVGRFLARLAEYNR